jgi:hypothetical protein
MPEELPGPDGSDPAQTCVQSKTDIGSKTSGTEPAGNANVLLGQPRLGEVKVDTSLLTSPEKSRLGEVEVGASLLTPSPKKSRKWVSDHGEDVHKRKKQRLESGASLLTPSPENVRNGVSDDDDRKESDHQKERPSCIPDGSTGAGEDNGIVAAMEQNQCKTKEIWPSMGKRVMLKRRVLLLRPPQVFLPLYPPLACPILLAATMNSEAIAR